MRLFNSVSLTPLISPNASSRLNVALEFYRGGEGLKRHQDKRVDFIHALDHRRWRHLLKLAVGDVVKVERGRAGQEPVIPAAFMRKLTGEGCKSLGKMKVWSCYTYL